MGRLNGGLNAPELFHKHGSITGRKEQQSERGLSKHSLSLINKKNQLSKKVGH